jgi:hypothetical protein
MAFNSTPFEKPPFQNIVCLNKAILGTLVYFCISNNSMLSKMDLFVAKTGRAAATAANHHVYGRHSPCRVGTPLGLPRWTRADGGAD